MISRAPGDAGGGSHPATRPAGNLQRAVRQQLESLSRAGITHLPKLPEVARSAPQSNRADTVPSTHPPSVAEPDMPVSRSRSTPPSPKFAQAPEAPAAKGASKSAPRNLGLSERVSALNVLAQTVAQCTKCEILASTRTQTVFGVGNPQARILFIGEAPGADEDRTGEPFVGRAGQLLNKIIEAIQFKREEIYICNILKCRPPENRQPMEDECRNCRGFLDRQLEIISPDYIVCWGGVAAQNLLGSVLTIGKLRGKFHEHGRSKVLCTYHPSYLLRNPAAKKDVWEDMKILMGDMGIELPATGASGKPA